MGCRNIVKQPLRLTSPAFTNGIEIFGNYPYIDFHYGSSDEDYTARIYEYSKNNLGIRASIVTLADWNSKLVVGGLTASPNGALHVTGDIYCTGKVITDGGIQNNSQSAVSQQIVGGGISES